MLRNVSTNFIPMGSYLEQVIYLIEKEQIIRQPSLPLKTDVLIRDNQQVGCFPKSDYVCNHGLCQMQS